MKSDIGEEGYIWSAINRASSMRQKNPEKYYHAVAGVWNWLPRDYKDDLLEKLDELLGEFEKEEIADFDGNGIETSYDILDCLKTLFDGTKKKKEIQASEALANKIVEVLGDRAGSEMEKYSLRKRSNRGGNKK